MELIKSLLQSKKFVASLIGMLVAACAKVGLELDETAIATIVSPIIAFILGQGIADMGKEKAKEAKEPPTS